MKFVYHLFIYQFSCILIHKLVNDFLLNEFLHGKSQACTKLLICSRSIHVPWFPWLTVIFVCIGQDHETNKVKVK